ncbi:MAG: Crossover junction endodeoxyribonuclease RuvC [bacterium ADurb.Bin400]|nr:MAG: Crossover junction endodeoxyribonuclease RuvC [bacterium ADurb.Bin400]
MSAVATRTVLGIDPGTNIMGWGIVEQRGQALKVLKYGCVRTESNHSLATRLMMLFSAISDIVNTNHPDEVAIEELFFFKNQKTVMSVAQARGAAVVAVMKHRVPVFEYTPLQVKQALTGYGRADKKQVQEMVRLTCGLSHCPKPDDAADALAVAICHVQTNQQLTN